MVGRRSRGIFLILLIVSILLHGFAWKWLELRDWQQPKQVNKLAATTTRVVLQYLPLPQKVLIPETLISEEPAPEEHAPIHNAGDFASSNNSDKSVNKITPGEQPDIKGNLITKELQTKSPQSNTTQLKSNNIEEFHKNEYQKIEKSAAAENGKSVISSIESIQSTIPIAQNEYFEQALSGGSLSTKFNSQDTKPAIPDEALVVLGNMKLLDDYHLGEVEVKEPFSEIEAKRIRMVNRYLERMEKQIHDEWIKPEISNKQLAGVIKFSLSPEGYLHDVYIYLGSGDSALDHSALEAVKRVKKFSVPESTLLAAKYYSNLRFQFSSQDFVGESIPLF